MVEPYIYDVPRPKVKVGVILKTYFFMIWSRFGHAMSSIYKSSGKAKTMLIKYFLASFFIKVRIISWGRLQNQCL